MASILIVDDEQQAVDILKMMLEDAGFEVLTADNGESGFSAACEHRPDVIIADVLMPVMDGYALYKQLKSEPVTKHIPVIILTARGAMESAFEAIGVDCFLEKPVETGVLIAQIQELLGHAAGSSRKRHQKVLVAGTYPEVVEQITEYAQGLGHKVRAVHTAAEIIKESVLFMPDIMILEVQTEAGSSTADVIRAVRMLPEIQDIPILLYSYYHVSDLADSDFRSRVLSIEKAKDACMNAGGIEYFDRYNRDLFKDWAAKYL